MTRDPAPPLPSRCGLARQHTRLEGKVNPKETPPLGSRRHREEVGAGRGRGWEATRRLGGRQGLDKRTEPCGPCDALSGQTLTKVAAGAQPRWDTAPGPRQLEPNLSRHAARGSSPSDTLQG